MTKIEWCDRTWNPIIGCSRVSEGCRNCYAERLAATRLKHLPQYHDLTTDSGRWSGTVRLIGEKLTQPYQWRASSRIFVNSMSDLFHEELDRHAIGAVLRVLNTGFLARWHQFIVLTKRPRKMAQCLADWEDATTDRPDMAPIGLEKVWWGVSVEDQKNAEARLPILIDAPIVQTRIVSCEPLLGLCWGRVKPHFKRK